MSLVKTKRSSVPSWNDLSARDMPNSDMRMVADALGVKAAVELMKNFGGTSLIVPKNGKSKLMEKYVIDNYDGNYTTIKQLVRQSGLSQRRVLLIIAQHKKNGNIKS